MIAATGTAQGEALHAGSDGVVVIDASHPGLHTTVSHDQKEHHDIIDMVAPQLFFITDSGEITSSGIGKTDWPAYVETLHKLGVKVLPIVRNRKHSPPGRMLKLLGNTEAVDQAVQNLTALCLKHQFDGYILDIERLTAADREPLTAFVSQLYKSLGEKNRLLVVSVGARAWIDQFDFVGLSQNSNALFVMFYDYTGNWTKGKQPGPTAPMATWPGQPNTVESDLDALIDMGVPADKIIMGIPEYGYDFTLDEKGKVKSAKPLWNSQLHEIAREYHAEVKWSEHKQASYFDYTDASGAKHQAWLESTKSYRAKLDLARSRHIAGIGTWASVWPEKPTDKAFWPTVQDWLRMSSPK